MKKTTLSTILLLLVTAPSSALSDTISGAKNHPETIISRIAFGSCSKQNKKQPLWQDVLVYDPDIWVWLGDNIYADTRNMAEMKRKYDVQKNHTDYQKLLHSCMILGIWDDHDYGENNTGKSYPKKMESQKLFLDFIDEHPESRRREQEGIYASYTFGPPGKIVKFILLDVRYHRNPPGDTNDILGEQQWLWLEQELNNSTADINIIASGTQVIPVEYPKKREVWVDYPVKRYSLFRIIGESRAKGVIIISGDPHFAEISKLDTNALSYPLYEITSSGLTETAPAKKKKNLHRTGQPYSQINFGIIEVNWNTLPVIIFLRIMGRKNNVIIEKKLRLDELQPDSTKTGF